MAEGQLAALRHRVESGAVEVSSDLRKGLLERIDDLTSAIDAAQAALALHVDDATDVVAQRLVYCEFATGPGWRRYLAEVDSTHAIHGEVDRALAADVANLHTTLTARLPKPRSGSCGVCESAEKLITCPNCGRDYCPDHSAREEVWSGSWLESVNGTCPFGHEWDAE